MVALLSRLHPSWFPAADQTARFLVDSRERLSYPLNYWNGLAALIAIGIPLVAQVAVGAKSILLRALRTAALPALGLTLFFTLSRGGIAAALIALALFLAFASDRLPKFLVLLGAGAGTAILVLAAAGRDSLQHGLLDATARQQGDEMLLMTVVICLLAGAFGAAIAAGEARRLRPRWTYVSRSRAQGSTLAGLLAVLVIAVAVNAPGRLSNAWGDFKEGGSPGAGTDRLGSVAGQGRYEFWRSALDQNGTDPLLGTGSGTFEYWWARNGDIPEVVRDTHSLYLQTLGELGIVGLLLLAAFLLSILAGGARNAIRAGPSARTQLAAVLGGCVAFCLTAGVDWMWQIPVLPACLLLLASVLVMPVRRRESGGPLLRHPAWRLRGRRIRRHRRDRDPARRDEPGATERGRVPRRRPAGRAPRRPQRPERRAGRGHATAAAGVGARGAGGLGGSGGRRPGRHRTGVDQLAHLAGPFPDRGKAWKRRRRGTRLRHGPLPQPALKALSALMACRRGRAWRPGILPARSFAEGER